MHLANEHHAPSATPSPNVYVLIPCHNNKQDVFALLGCLRSQTYSAISIVLVDDGSTDGTREAVRVMFPQATIIHGDGDLWWAGATALGIEHILKQSRPSDFILLLNNDVAVNSDYVQRLVETSCTSARAIVGSVLYDFHTRRFIESGIILDQRLRASVNTDSMAAETQEYDGAVSVLPGRGTLIPVEVFSTIGTLNSRQLPHYGADYEFSVRARRAGFGLVVSHRAKVYAKLDVTGLVCPVGKVLSWKECWEILFSKKSKINILYYLRYVWLCSERRWRVQNTFANAANILSLTIGQTVTGRVVTALVSPVWRIIYKPCSLLFGRGSR